MKVELVDVMTDDEITLTGALAEPTQAKNEVPGVDIALMMHGNSANFYHPFYRYFAERLAQMGCATLRVNNRGHDVISRATGSRNTVSALEAFHDDISTQKVIQNG